MLGSAFRVVRLCVVFLCCSTCLFSEPVEQDSLLAIADTTSTTARDYRFSPKQLIAPLSLTTVGSFGLMPNFPLHKLSNRIHQEVIKHDYHTRVDNVIQYAPVALHLGLGFTGYKSRFGFRDRLLAAATAYVFKGILTNSVKYTVREERPDQRSRNSFPSGHTATAFTGAELVRIEYGNGFGAMAYGIATAVGAMRVYNDRHWAHDVVAGAGVGILCAKAGYWMLPLWQRLFHKKERGGKVAAIAPMYEHGSATYGLTISLLY